MNKKQRFLDSKSLFFEKSVNAGQPFLTADVVPYQVPTRFCHETASPNLLDRLEGKDVSLTTGHSLAPTVNPGHEQMVCFLVEKVSQL